MHWLVTDETNKTAAEGDFFIYGGLVLTDAQVKVMHQELSEIRLRYGYLSADDFKIQARSRPPHVSPENALGARVAALAAANEACVRMIVYVIHHGIASGGGPERTIRFAINSVVSSFHRLLEAGDAMGLVLVDRMDEKYAYPHLKQLFQHGHLLNTGTTISLGDRIVQYGMSSNNASHISSLVDIALGAFRYCANTACGKGDDNAAQKMFPTLAQLMWGREVNGEKRVGGLGYIARPKGISAPLYQSEYSLLASRLSAFAADPTEAREATEHPDPALGTVDVGNGKRQPGVRRR